MKRKFSFMILLCCLGMMCIGCVPKTQTQTAELCAKCGRAATTTVSGPAEIIRQYGVPSSKCREITSGIYAASLCSSCLGPVTTIAPNP